MKSPMLPICPHATTQISAAPAPIALKNTDPQFENYYIDMKTKHDSRESFLVIVRFNAADIMRRRRV